MLRMELILILGPMKSGKSLDLISYFSFLQYTNKTFGLYQPLRNVRDEQIHTRHGISMEAKKVTTLAEALDSSYDVIGVDEMHMFPESEALIIEQLLKNGKKVVVSSLDTDPYGRLFEIVRCLLELGPKEVRYRRAACECCKNPEAVYTQILQNGEPVISGIPASVPDDGTYGYRSVCRHCFVKEGKNMTLPINVATIAPVEPIMIQQPLV